MKRIIAAFAAATCIAAVMGGSAVFAQAPTSTMRRPAVPLRPTSRPHPAVPATKKNAVPASQVTPQQKAASDQAMKAALPELQAASSAMQSGNRDQTMDHLLTAIRSMNGALGIYHGHRDLAMLSAGNAYNALGKNETRQTKAIAGQIAAAIREDQLATNSN